MGDFAFVHRGIRFRSRSRVHIHRVSSRVIRIHIHIPARVCVWSHIFAYRAVSGAHRVYAVPISNEHGSSPSSSTSRVQRPTCSSRARWSVRRGGVICVRQHPTAQVTVRTYGRMIGKQGGDVTMDNWQCDFGQQNDTTPWEVPTHGPFGSLFGGQGGTVESVGIDWVMMT